MTKRREPEQRSHPCGRDHRRGSRNCPSRQKPEPRRVAVVAQQHRAKQGTGRSLEPPVVLPEQELRVALPAEEPKRGAQAAQIPWRTTESRPAPVRPREQRRRVGAGLRHPRRQVEAALTHMRPRRRKGSREPQRRSPSSSPRVGRCKGSPWAWAALGRSPFEKMQRQKPGEWLVTLHAERPRLGRWTVGQKLAGQRLAEPKERSARQDCREPLASTAQELH